MTEEISLLRKSLRGLGAFARLARLLFCSTALYALLSASPAACQEENPQSYAGFEGQPVSSVDMSGQPDMDVDAFRGSLKQKAGQPFAMQSVRDSVAALQATHLFSQVQVKLTPEPAGVSVLFILEPAAYIGILSFPGAEDVFPYVRLLQVVNIPEQSPYVTSLGTQGEKALIAFFVSDGFFEAKVTSEPKPDDVHKIVNLIFHCSLGRRAKIGTIAITGVPPEEAENARRSLESLWARLRRSSLKPGNRYAKARIQRSAEYLQSHLRKNGRLAPNVEQQADDYDAVHQQANLTLKVTPGPRVAVMLTGARLSKRSIRRLVPIFEENSVDHDLMDEGQRNLVSYFQSKGYLDVQVMAAMDPSATESDVTNVVYAVERGAKHRVEQVSFQGNQYFSDKQLDTYVSVRKGRFRFRGSYSNDKLRKSTETLAAVYKNAGFPGVSVHPIVQDFEPQVDVTFEITEGPQDKVGSFVIEDARAQPITLSLPGGPLNLQTGKPYSPQLLQKDRDRILADLLNRGYLNAAFHSRTVPDPADAHILQVTYTVDQGPQAHISGILPLGLQHTRPDLIRDATSADISAGAPIGESSLLKSEDSLYNVGTFDWASVKTRRPISSQSEEEVLVKVHESKRYSMDVGGGLEIIPQSANIPVGAVAVPGIPAISLGNKFTVSQRSLVGPRGSFSIERHNIRGRAETASLGFVLSRLDQRALFTFADPYLHGSRWSSLLSLSAERTTQNPIYTAELGQASFQVERQLDANKTKRLILRYSFQRTILPTVLVPDLVLPADRSVRLSGFDVEYVRDTRDKALDAHRGIYQTFDLGVTPTALGSSANFVRFLGQTAIYKQIRPWLVLAQNVRFGFAKSFDGSDVPLSQRFFSGGADSLRGFPIDGAGPQRPVTVCSNPANLGTCTLISVPVGGNMLFIVNSEARFPIPLKKGLGGAVFYDGGNVYSNINVGQFADDFTHTIGVGVRYNTPAGPIRFDVGRRLTNVAGVKDTQYFVTLGQSF